MSLVAAKKYPSKKEFAAEFRRDWESEIMSSYQYGNEDDLLWYWDMRLEVETGDGRLPPRASRWTPPKWLVALNLKYHKVWGKELWVEPPRQ